MRRKFLLSMFMLLLCTNVIGVRDLYAQTTVSAADDLKTAIEAGGEVTLGADITLSETVVIPSGKAVVLDLNGKTITSTLGTAIKNIGTFTVKDSGTGGTINARVRNEKVMTLESGSIHYNDSYPVYTFGSGSKFTMNGGSVTNAAPTSELGNGNQGTSAAAIVSNANANIELNAGTVTSVYMTGWPTTLAINGATVEYGLRSVSKNDLTITAGDICTQGGSVTINTSGTVSITGGTFRQDISAYLTGNSVLLDNGDGTYSVVDGYFQVGEEYYATLADAFNAAAAGQTITLLSNIALEDETFTIADGKSITLDMNGKKITVTDNKTENYELFYIYGGMTVTGEGTIELTATNNREWNAMSAIFHNRGGELTINNGTFTHKGGTDMAYVIDNSGNHFGDATTIIDNGTLTSTYTAIRNRMEENSHGASGTAYLTVNGGAIDGDTSAIWAQAASTSETSPATGEIEIKGGTIGVVNTARSTGAECMTTISGGTVEKVKCEVGELTVTGGTVNQVEILTSEGEPADYVVTEDGLYTTAVAKVNDTNYATLEEAIKAAAPSGTVEILSDVTVDEWIMISETLNIGSGQIITMNINGLTINGNGKTVTIKDIESAGNGNRLFYDATKLNVKDLTIECVEDAVNAGGIGLTSGTIENVTFIGGGPAVYPGAGDVIVKGCTFETNGTSIYYEEERDKLVVTENTFENPDNVNAILLRGNTTFTNNIVVSGRTVNVVSGSPVVTGNDFNDVRFKVYNAATATIENNEINVLAFNDNSVVFSTFGVNTLSQDAQAVLDAASFPVAQIGTTKYGTLEDAFAAATEGQTITLLADATPALTSQRAITKAAVIDLGGKTLTLTEDDLYFGTTTFQNGNIVVDPSVKANTAVFWMFENQTLTFDNVKLTATGVTGTYLIGINGGTGSNVNLLNGTNIIINNASQAALSAVICDNGTGNNVKIENSDIDVNNIEGRFYLGGISGNITVDNTDIDLNGVKEGFYLRANQTLSIEGESEVEVVLNDTNNRYGINITDYSATYTKDDLATVNATVYDPVVRVKNLTELQTALVENVDKPIFATEIIVISEGTLELDLNTRRVFAADKNVIRNDGATLTIKNGTIERVGDVVGYAFNNAQGALNITGTTIKGGLYTSGTSLVATNANISHFQSSRHAIYAYDCNVTLNGGTYHNDNSGNATIMAAGSSVVTIKDGTFSIKDGRQELGWTSCLTDTQNTASITVEGGTFNGGFRVQTGTTMTIEGGSFNDCYGSGYNIYGTAVVKGGTFTDANAINFAKGNLAEGYVASDNGNGTFTVLKGVAKIGDTYYATLQEAINASQDNDEIVLLDNVTDVDATISKKVTLNLNEKTITDAYIIITSEVNIKGGSIKNVNEPYPLVVQNGGKLTVDGVGIEASKSDRAIWVRNGSELVFNNSSILATKGEGNNKTNLIAAIYTDSNTDVTINSGTITVDTPDNKAVAIYGNYENANVTVNGGKISTSGKNYSYGINVDGDITVTGGEIVTNEKGYAYPSGIRYGYNYALVTATGNVTITGGSITTNGHSGYAVNVGRTYNSNDQTVSITGGTFTNNLSEVEMTTGNHNAPVLVWTGTASTVTATIENGNFSGYNANLFRKDNEEDNSTLEVSGGTFDREINGEYLAEGYAITANENGTYGVSLASYVVLPEGVTAENYKEKFGDNTVTDGTNYYATMTAALNAVYGTETTLYCKPGANVGQMTHGAIKETLTVYGNDAYTSGNGDFDIGNCNYEGKEITSDITLTVKHLDGCGAWGYKNTEHTINIVFENCKDMSEVYLSGTAGRTNITMTNCEFTDNVDGGNCKVYSNADGTITLKDMLFSGVDKAVNFNHKATGTQTIALENCTFTNCGDDFAGDEIPVRVLSSVAGGNSVLTVTDCTFTGTPEGGADILLDYGVGLTEATVSNTAAKVVVEKENNVGETTIVAANETKSFVNLVPVAKIGDAVYYTFEDAIAAAVADASITSIEILRDYTQTYYIEAGKTYSILENQNLTVVAPEGKSYTITLDRTIGETFSIYQMSANSSLTIADNVTIEGLEILANGFATSGNNTNINGTLKAMSLKQWTSDGTITVSETGKVWLGYGDGQFDLAYGNGAVVINGNGDKTEAQFKAGYSGTRGNGNTLTLNNTYFEAGAWFNLNGTNGIVNINNSLLKVSGGDNSGSMTIKAGNTVNVNESSIFECAKITVEEGATIVVNGGTLKATTLTNNGTVVVSGTGASTLFIENFSGNAIELRNGTLVDSHIAGGVNAFGTNNINGTTIIGGILSLGYETNPSEQVVVNITGNFNGSNVIVSTNNGVDNLLNVGTINGERTTAHFGQLGAFADVNIVNSDVTYGYAFVRNDFNVTNSTMEITGGVNTYFSGNAKVVLDKTTWNLSGFANIGSYGGYMYGNADVTLMNGSSMTATNLGIEQYDGKTVILTLEDSSTLTATNLSNTGSIVLAGEEAKITSNELTGTNNVPTTNIEDHKVVYENGAYVVTAKHYVAQVKGTDNNVRVKFETFAEALDAVENGETIELLGTEGSEISKEIDFTEDIEFTITGNAPNYGLPIVTFQNATVNIKDATILIPELDARQDATINVINSTVYDAGGNSIAKSYYNGAINIDAESTVYTMQVTTMGYITVAGTLNATWQTNVYGNGLITLNEGATFNTAALQLTAKDYSGRDNTDADRVGQPAEIVVNGATLNVGKVQSSNGADYSYHSSYGINVGTIEGKSAILNIINGGTVNYFMKDGETANIGAGGTVNVNASTFNVACRAENGTVTLANAGTINVENATVEIAKLDNDNLLFISGENTFTVEDATGSSYALRAKDGVVFNNSYVKGTANETIRLLGSATFNGGFECAYLQGQKVIEDNPLNGGIGGTIAIEEGTTVHATYGVEISNDYTLNGGNIELSGGNADGDLWGFVFQNSECTINSNIKVVGNTGTYAPIHFTNVTATVNGNISQSNSGGEVIYIKNSEVTFAENSNVTTTTGVHVNDGSTLTNRGEINGNVTVNSTLLSENNITGAIVKAATATIQLTGGIYTTEPQDGWCAENYGAFPYDENSWVVRMVYGTQEFTLTAGWNWMSSYISEFDTDGLTMLTTKLGENGVQIKNNLGAYTYGGSYYGWSGNLTATSVKEMYKVNVTADVTFEFEGGFVNYDELEIPLYPGWNYIGYPVDVTTNIADALIISGGANFMDVIKSQNGTSTYAGEDTGWLSSDFFTLIPGEGYMYQNTSGVIKTLKYSTKVTTTTSNNRNRNHWTVDATQYPSNMTMIAMTDVEGGDYEVAAFVNGEVRGSARPIYVEELDAHILILTISGNDVEEMTFMYYDIATGEEVELSNRINYSNDAIVGSIAEPYMLTRGTTGIGEASMSEISIYPNPTTTGTEINLQATCDRVEVYNALGVKVAEYQNVDSIDAIETAGIYVIRITNDGNVQNCRLVVK